MPEIDHPKREMIEKLTGMKDSEIKEKIHDILSADEKATLLKKIKDLRREFEEFESINDYTSKRLGTFLDAAYYRPMKPYASAPTTELKTLLTDCKTYLEPMHKNKKVLKLIERLKTMLEKL